MGERRPTVRQKQAIASRARGLREYCRSQERFATQGFSVEHIVPRQQGGRTVLRNLALACQGCNNHKYAKTEAGDPVGGGVAPLFHPRRQCWQDHFAWDPTYALIIGITPNWHHPDRPGDGRGAPAQPRRPGDLAARPIRGGGASAGRVR